MLREGDQLVLHTADGVEFALPIAGLGARSYAFVIDWHIRLVLAFAWWIVALLILTGGGADLAHLFMAQGRRAAVGAILPGLAIYLLYHPVLEVLMKGRTPGKRLAGVRVVTLEGATPGVSALLIRNVFRLLDSLPGVYMVGLTSAMLTRHHVRIGDLAAGTVLVYERQATLLEARLNLYLGATGRLPQGQLEVLRELLDRWPELDRQKRGALAVRFFTQIGGQLPREEDTLQAEDRAMYARLNQLFAQACDHSLSPKERP